MSKISKEGYEQITIIKNALNSMFDKLDRTVYVDAACDNLGAKDDDNDTVEYEWIYSGPDAASDPLPDSYDNIDHHHLDVNKYLLLLLPDQCINGKGFVYHYYQYVDTALLQTV